MPAFKYAARSADGKQVKGSINAISETVAVQELRKQNLTVVTMTAEAAKKKGGGLFGGNPRPHVSNEDLAVFTRQLATMISAGIPLLECLEILEEQAEDPGFKFVLDTILARVRGGSDFSESLAEHPKLFTRIYVSMIKAGEAGGALDAILNRLAEYMEATEKLRREIKSAMTYPVVSLCLILLITVGLMVGIVPKFNEIFVGLNMEDKLPAPTKVLLLTSKFMKTQWYIWVGGMIGLFVAFKVWKSTPAGERQWHWLSLRAPIFGTLMSKVCISRFARTFATLVQSGVPILGALEIVAATSGNRIVEDAINSARESVRKGETLGEPLAKSGVFPLMVTRMISIGEKSGALQQLLEKISEFYDQQVEATVAALTSLIEPLLIAVMGVLVGGIVLAIFLPILKIQEAVRGGKK
ncbi:MAG: type II secretion system F family protein [Planctomycetes bacterium]|nr:type II secretion system F family protein [Planctomycetota bacterium]